MIGLGTLGVGMAFAFFKCTITLKKQGRSRWVAIPDKVIP